MSNRSNRSEKKEFRELYKARRGDLSPGEREALSARICAHLTDSDPYRRAQYLYAYYPLGSEADIRPAVKAAWQEKKRVAFPRVFGDAMRFFEVKDFGDFEEGSFGIMEPKESGKAVDWRRDSGLLVLVPGLAFDRQGGRLGYGKGYYDRYLGGSEISSVTLIGVGFAGQIADALPTDENDLVLPWIVTEDGMFHTEKTDHGENPKLKYR